MNTCSLLTDFAFKATSPSYEVNHYLHGRNLLSNLITFLHFQIIQNILVIKERIGFFFIGERMRSLKITS
jgi:hypothetical protein